MVSVIKLFRTHSSYHSSIYVHIVKPYSCINVKGSRSLEHNLVLLPVMIPCYGLRKDLLSPTSTVSQGGAFPEFHFVQDPLSRVFESSSPGLRSKSSIIQPTGKDLAHASSTALETFEHTTKVNYFSSPRKRILKGNFSMFCGQRRSKVVTQKQKHQELFQSD